MNIVRTRWKETQYTNHGGTQWVRSDEAEKRIAALEAKVREYQDELVDEHNTLLDAEAENEDYLVQVGLWEKRADKAEAELAKWKWIATHEVGRDIKAVMRDRDRDPEQIEALEWHWAERGHG